MVDGGLGLNIKVMFCGLQVDIDVVRIAVEERCAFIRDAKR